MREQEIIALLIYLKGQYGNDIYMEHQDVAWARIDEIIEEYNKDPTKEVEILEGLLGIAKKNFDLLAVQSQELQKHLIGLATEVLELTSEAHESTHVQYALNLKNLKGLKL